MQPPRLALPPLLTAGTRCGANRGGRRGEVGEEEKGVQNRNGREDWPPSLGREVAEGEREAERRGEGKAGEDNDWDNAWDHKCRSPRDGRA